MKRLLLCAGLLLAARSVAAAPLGMDAGDPVGRFFVPLLWTGYIGGSLLVAAAAVTDLTGHPQALAGTTTWGVLETAGGLAVAGVGGITAGVCAPAEECSGGWLAWSVGLVIGGAAVATHGIWSLATGGSAVTVVPVAGNGAGLAVVVRL